MYIVKESRLYSTLDENIKIVKMNDNDKSSIAILRDLGRNHRKIKKFFDNSQSGRKKRRKKSQFESFK